MLVPVIDLWALGGSGCLDYLVCPRPTLVHLFAGGLLQEFLRSTSMDLYLKIKTANVLPEFRKRFKRIRPRSFNLSF